MQSLRDLARKSPSTPAALLLVSGIGMKKLERYGDRILETIRRHSTLPAPEIAIKGKNQA